MTNKANEDLVSRARSRVNPADYDDAAALPNDVRSLILDLAQAVDQQRIDAAIISNKMVFDALALMKREIPALTEAESIAMEARSRANTVFIPTEKTGIRCRMDHHPAMKITPNKDGDISIEPIPRDMFFTRPDLTKNLMQIPKRPAGSIAQRISDRILRSIKGNS